MHLVSEPIFIWEEDKTVLPDSVFDNSSINSIGGIGMKTVVWTNIAEKIATIYYIGTDNKLIDSYEVNIPHTIRHDGDDGYYGVKTGETLPTETEIMEHFTEMFKKTWIYETGRIPHIGIASQYGGSGTEYTTRINSSSIGF